jgi:hypothetical protein
MLPKLMTSSIPSKTILPPFPALNIGPFVSVPLLLPLKSFQLLPEPE